MTKRVGRARSIASASSTPYQCRASSSPDPASVPPTALASTMKKRALKRTGLSGGVIARQS